MLKKHLNKLILMIILILSTTACLRLPTGKEDLKGWVKTSDGWSYYDNDGYLLTDCWIEDKYYVDKHGNMVTNDFVTSKGMKYYLGEDGVYVVNQWIKKGKIYYHLDESGVLVESLSAKEIEGREAEVLETTDSVETASEQKVVSIYSSDDFSFGTYYINNNYTREPIEWKVLSRDETTNSVLVISKYALDILPYNDEHKNTVWTDCTLREWLNTYFLTSAFTSSEMESIISANLLNPRNGDYITPSGNDSIDKIFVLSADEALEFTGSNENRVCLLSEYAKLKINGSDNKANYWLRTAGRTQTQAVYVDTIGQIVYRGIGVESTSIAVRPAMWIKY